MPLFDIECKNCKRIHEVFLDKYEEVIVFNCSNCKNKYHEVLPPLVSMQPDSMWFGKQTDLGYFTSKKTFNNYIKQNNLERVDRSILEDAHKKYNERKADPLKKTRKQMEKFLEKELASVEISPDGTTIKEINDFNKARGRENND